MTDIVITLVFSVVMLVFMAFPSMKIVAWLRPKTNYSEQTYNVLQILITVLLSLVIGIFLKFA
jgi:archaellum biogenesis protein FlaJ (TadC family)